MEENHQGELGAVILCCAGKVHPRPCALGLVDGEIFGEYEESGIRCGRAVGWFVGSCDGAVLVKD